MQDKPLNLINKSFNNIYRQNKFVSYVRVLWDKLNIDTPLFLGILLLASCGLVILYSASNSNLQKTLHQLTVFFIGFVAMVICAKIPIYKYQKIAPWLFGSIFVMLLIVLISGAISKGAQRWLDIGLFRFQPSESLKLIMPIMVAWYLKDKLLPPNFRVLFISILIIFIPSILILKQPDLGTAVMIVISGMSVLLFAGIKLRFLIFGSVTTVISLPLLWRFLHTYQKERVLTFLNPERDPLGSGYNIIQSKIAVGSGGVFGKGLFNGTQSHLQFLPEHTTDFIFGVLSEEFGLLGCLFVFGICLYIVFRGLYISSQSQDTFSRLLAAGLSLTFFFCFFVNVGMVIGILPVVGLPLPLISYGGTSIVTLMAGFGIIMSIKANQKLLPS